ncbi:hypothetical protein T12_15805 [Trichinella patagoniensis]|uniref:Uncharacterized protein n=1 Tax=Trichinella patagoniensis TaxID=990121 RepID=A0A0V0Z3Q2_9BILA|nr:hypothetical protein T12_15805 [Trichinella patagoniensis]
MSTNVGESLNECGVSRKTATGENTIHDLLNRKDVGDKKIDEKPEENITKVCLKMIVDKKDGSSSYSNGSLQIARAVSVQRMELKELLIAFWILERNAHFFNQRNEHRKLMRVELRLKGVDNDNFCV